MKNLIKAVSDAKLRSAATRAGLKACKSRKTSDLGTTANEGGYMLVDRMFNTIVAGNGYSLTAEQAYKLCKE